MIKLLFRYTSLFLLFAFSTFSSTAEKSVVTIVSFNLENLFDTKDDPDNPHDDTYLPLTEKNNRTNHEQNCEENTHTDWYKKQCIEMDWSQAVYEQKLENLATVINAMPSVPDVIVVPETENIDVLNDLVNVESIRNLGYNTVQLDTSDKPLSRGIDVGLLTRLPLHTDPPVAHTIDFGRDQDKCRATRDTLQVTLTLPDGEPLHIYGVHFPSGGNPVTCRIRAMMQLNELVSELPKDTLYLAAGDFNFNCNETPAEFFRRMLTLGKWYISPVAQQGCTAPGSSKFTDRRINFWHTWSFLDLILVSSTLSPTQSSTKNWFADLGSFQTLAIHPNQIAVDEKNRGFIQPRRFNPVTGEGVSDHWPVGIRLLPRRSQ